MLSNLVAVVKIDIGTVKKKPKKNQKKKPKKNNNKTHEGYIEYNRRNQKADAVCNGAPERMLLSIEH